MLKLAKSPATKYYTQQTEYNQSTRFLAIPSAKHYKDLEMQESIIQAESLAIKAQSKLLKTETTKKHQTNNGGIDLTWQISLQDVEQAQSVVSHNTEKKPTASLEGVAMTESLSHFGCVEVSACGGQVANDVTIEKTAD